MSQTTVPVIDVKHIELRQHTSTGYIVLYPSTLSDAVIVDVVNNHEVTLTDLIQAYNQRLSNLESPSVSNTGFYEGGVAVRTEGDNSTSDYSLEFIVEE